MCRSIDIFRPIVEAGVQAFRALHCTVRREEDQKDLATQLAVRAGSPIVRNRTDAVAFAVV